MSVDRRSMLKMAGAAAIVLAAGGTTFVLTRRPAAAMAPWSAAGNGFSDPRLRAVSYAILAPNPHNRQPWLIDLRRAGELTVHCDGERLLPVTDPHGRQIVIGLGCFLELLRMAAAADGYIAEIIPLSDGASLERLGAGPVARVRFDRSDDARKDPLFDQVLARRTNKEPYDTTRQIDNESLALLADAAGAGLAVAATNDRRRVADLRALTWRATETEFMTPEANMESVRLMRIGKAEIEADPDGIDLGGPVLETLSAFGVLTRDNLADPNSSAFRQGLDMYREITGTAMAYIWVKSAGNSRATQLDVGRAWVRINLKAAELGIGIHPLSQALQEYAEMRPHFDAAHRLAGAGDGERVQMLGRLGYGPSVAPSPRWPAASRVREA